ncbi:Protein EARLY FLOWERING 3 [Quillaja saponaria]|uniref:Protein EARLY FLOWERING 3 n=1 Tax=Quillaja saponaria TaxID=32244 RepID=A0AAD7PTN8_QUISA|nr:Protein EARLY FLOWERING 3 [Quillaja saponaria]
MKRGKDDEKVMGPMFPRLHINDTEKGGPRAPPRNKMALYEQLSIPSQRFNSGHLAPIPNNTSNKVPPPPSSEGADLERNQLFPIHLPPAKPTHRAEKSPPRQSDGTNANTSLPHLEQRKRSDEDEFKVPVYVQSWISQSNHDNAKRSINCGKLTPFSSTLSGCAVEVLNDCDGDPKQISSPNFNLSEDVRYGSEGNQKTSITSRNQSVKSARNLLTGENIVGQERQYNASVSKENHDRPAANHSRLRDSDACLQQGSETGSPSDDTGCGDGVVESTRNTEWCTVSLPRGCFPIGTDDDIVYHDKRMVHSLPMGNLDKSNVSKPSMVDNLSCMDISPDDVVGLIGQKHFWKARTEIVNQQRVFAVQVFELHRLIKVQQLIAGSPDILLDDCAFLGKSSPKESPAKKLSVEYVIKPRPQNLKHKNDSEKPPYKMECSAENAIGRTSLSSVKNGSHPSNMGNPQQASVAPNSSMDPWSFNQSPGHQWLIPVMSPSEGLVYKPYPVPGFTGPVCGGCGPFGSAPLTGDFINPVYGVPTSHQRIGAFPGTPPLGLSYFPPYGTPVINSAMSGSAVEQMNQFFPPVPHGQSGRLSGGGANFNVHNEGPCDAPIQRNGAISQNMKFQTSKGGEVQRSTASSPSETARVDTAQITKGRDALPLFPMAPAIPEGAPQPHESDQPRRVIKVVPHNRRSATESAARIFQSIQEEREQFDTV